MDAGRRTDAPAGAAPAGLAGTATVIAIDGPSGSGKSSTARAVAARLGLDTLDTGAMYRGVTWAALREGVPLHDAEAVAALARRVGLELGSRALGDRILVDGHDATAAIRGPEVTAAVSQVAANPAVRAELTERARAWVASRGAGVVEGRDIGTVVFPEAAVKVYLVARDSVRADRRAAEEAAAARSVDAGFVLDDLARRDRADSTRAVAPLRQARDAMVIDTSERSIDDVVDEIVERWLARSADVAAPLDAAEGLECTDLTDRADSADRADSGGRS